MSVRRENNDSKQRSVRHECKQTTVSEIRNVIFRVEMNMACVASEREFEGEGMCCSGPACVHENSE
jgi:hypothetical protein